jgi:hypothetical protein
MKLVAVSTDSSSSAEMIEMVEKAAKMSIVQEIDPQNKPGT